MDPALPPARTQDADLLFFVRDVKCLHQARPDNHRLGEILVRQGLRGMSLATIRTLPPSIHVQSRFFATPVGIDEDPVTGSVHGPLAAYLVREKVVKPHDGVAALMCIQGKSGGRAGLVYALVEPKPEGEFNVRIGGQVVTTMRGVLHPG